ncbi:MAG TPA: von Willebrand factor type A domain-containing protein, partial [Myxococcota bacterium]|nr:von Willebrand factor type A domain-containing protein [Myxococcota bacterium]
MTSSFPYRLAGLLSFVGLCWGISACGAVFQRHAPVSPDAYAAFEHHGVHPVVDASEERTATVGLSRDRASYTIARHYLEAGRWPPAAAVRVEDFVAALAGGSESDGVGTWPSSIAPSPFRPGWHVLVLRVSAARLGWAPDRRRPIVVSDREGGLETTFARWGFPVRRGTLAELEHEGPVILVSSGAGLGGPEAQGALLRRAAEQRRRGPVSIVGRLEGGLDDALLDAIASAGGGLYEVVRPEEAGTFDAVVDRLVRPAVATDARLVVDFEGVRRWRLIGYESTSPAPWSGEVSGSSLHEETVHVLFELDLDSPSGGPAEGARAGTGSAEVAAGAGAARNLGTVTLEA